MALQLPGYMTTPQVKDKGGPDLIGSYMSGMEKKVNEEYKTGILDSTKQKIAIQKESNNQRKIENRYKQIIDTEINTSIDALQNDSTKTAKEKTEAIGEIISKHDGLSDYLGSPSIVFSDDGGPEVTLTVNANNIDQQNINKESALYKSIKSSGNDFKFVGNYTGDPNNPYVISNIEEMSEGAGASGNVSKTSIFNQVSKLVNEGESVESARKKTAEIEAAAMNLGSPEATKRVQEKFEELLVGAGLPDVVKQAQDYNQQIISTGNSSLPNPQEGNVEDQVRKNPLGLDL